MMVLDKKVKLPSLKGEQILPNFMVIHQIMVVLWWQNVKVSSESVGHSQGPWQLYKICICIWLTFWKILALTFFFLHFPSCEVWSKHYTFWIVWMCVFGYFPMSVHCSTPLCPHFAPQLFLNAHRSQACGSWQVLETTANRFQVFLKILFVYM